jgi:hypothetical protein
MEEQIKDLIYAIRAGDSQETEQHINALMSQKAVAAMDDMRVEVAKNMFNQQEAE